MKLLGLSRAIVSDYFPGMSSRISGIGVIGIEKKIKELYAKFNTKNVFTLPIGGLYRYRKSGEDHQYQGRLIHLLTKCCWKWILRTIQKIFSRYT